MAAHTGMETGNQLFVPLTVAGSSDVQSLEEARDIQELNIGDLTKHLDWMHRDVE